LLLFVHFKAVSYTPNYFYNLHNFKQEWKEDENGLPASGDCEKACSTVILLLSVYNLPLSVFLLFRWWWRSRLAAWVLRFSASGDCEKACGTVIFLLSVYNLPLSVFLLFLWRWRSRFAAWVLLFFFGLQGAIEDENINVGFLSLLLVLVSVLWVSILCLSQFFFRSQSLRLSVLPCFSPYLLCFFLLPRGRLCSAFIEPAAVLGGNGCPPPKWS